MRCIYCDKPIDKISIATLFLEEDKLCVNCRNRLKLNRKQVNIGSLKVDTLYNYDGIFKELLIQYKECYDEALAPVFLYLLKTVIMLKYWGYKIVFVPSSKQKLEKRGFNHLELIFKDVQLNTVKGLKMKSEIIQEGKNLSQRRAMVDNYIYEGKKLNKVLIVDDVLTSGSSINGVYKAIYPYAKRVKALALARKENAFIENKKCDRINS